jgi:hypothetical protein
VYTLEEFLEANKGKSFDEIISQRKVRNGLAGGLEMRMVRNPLDGNIMDMRHVMVVGYQYGQFYGYLFEVSQWVRGLGQAFNGQDLYSNAIGEYFFVDQCQCRPYQTASSMGKVESKTTGDWTQDFYNWMTKP